MCTTAAPASAASMAEVAICSGVTGTCGLRPTVSPARVMGQVLKALQFNGSSPHPGSTPVAWATLRTPHAGPAVSPYPGQPRRRDDEMGRLGGMRATNAD